MTPEQIKEMDEIIREERATGDKYAHMRLSGFLEANAPALLAAAKENTQAKQAANDPRRSLADHIEMIHQRNDVLTQDGERFREIASAKQTENAGLRAIFPKILQALGNDSDCTESVSLEFLECVPSEVAGVIKEIRTRYNEADQCLMRIQTIMGDTDSTDDADELWSEGIVPGDEASERVANLFERWKIQCDAVAGLEESCQKFREENANIRLALADYEKLNTPPTPTSL